MCFVLQLTRLFLWPRLRRLLAPERRAPRGPVPGLLVSREVLWPPPSLGLVQRTPRCVCVKPHQPMHFCSSLSAGPGVFLLVALVASSCIWVWPRLPLPRWWSLGPAPRAPAIFAMMSLSKHAPKRLEATASPVPLLTPAPVPQSSAWLSSIRHIRVASMLSPRGRPRRVPPSP